MSKSGTTAEQRTGIPLEEGRRIAQEVVEKLEPWCVPGFIRVAGSIRRERPAVNDVDIVLVPRDAWRLLETVKAMGGAAGLRKIEHVIHDGVQVDLYIATPQSWATLLLIRTGSTQNNIRLCGIAKSRGWHLHANGEGLFNAYNERIAGDTEESIYRALGVPWQRPQERE